MSFTDLVNCLLSREKNPAALDAGSFPGIQQNPEEAYLMILNSPLSSRDKHWYAYIRNSSTGKRGRILPSILISGWLKGALVSGRLKAGLDPRQLLSLTSAPPVCQFSIGYDQNAPPENPRLIRNSVPEGRQRT